MSSIKATAFPSIPKALELNTGISLGLGLTNECSLQCAFCYRDPYPNGYSIAVLEDQSKQW